jgi:hypothetical protein
VKHVFLHQAAIKKLLLGAAAQEIGVFDRFDYVIKLSL